MIVLDVNILLYAYNTEAPQYTRALAFIEQVIDRPEIIGLPLPTVWAFLRISTDRRISRNPKTPGEAFQIVREWLALPGVIVVHPGPRHFEILERLVLQDQAAGPLISDAILAALAVENGAVLVSTDRDFSRFTDLRWVNPLA